MTTDLTKRILIVDDNDDIRSLLFTILRRRFLHVDEASDARAAASLLEANRYAVVLLDLMMPAHDGFELLDAFRQEKEDAPVVIVVTGASDEAIARLDPTFVHGIIRKPFDPEEVATIVAACAEIRSRRLFETMCLASVFASGSFIHFIS